MSLRVCNVPGCPTLTDTGRCSEHRRAFEKTRGTASQRGYGSTHQGERASWTPRVQAGLVRCRRCRKPLKPDAPWDLGHPDAWCSRPTAPECIPCNRATATRYAP